MTLSETLIVATGVGLLLLAGALGTTWVRSDLKSRQVWQLLATLDEALSAYHGVTGQWPALEESAPRREASRGSGESREQGEGGIARRPFGRDGEDLASSAERVVAALAGVPASRSVLETIPAILRVPARPSGQDTNDRASGTFQDAWGRRLGCLTAASRSESDRQAVAANGGRPLFVSAGPDGRFGTRDPDAADNLLRLPSPDR